MSAYSSKLNPRIRAFVEWRLEHYQDGRRMLAEYYADKLPSNVAAYGVEASAPRASGNGRPTEGLAVKIAADRYIVELERATAAIEYVTGFRRNGGSSSSWYTGAERIRRAEPPTSCISPGGPHTGTSTKC